MGPFFACKTLVAANHCNGHTEEQPFYNSDRHIPQFHAGRAKTPIGPAVNPQLNNAHEMPADNTHQVRVDNQKRRQQQARQNPRSSQIPYRVRTHTSDSINLFGHIHRSQLSGQRPPDTPGQHNCRKYRSQFLYY
ncbi:hypothetical protein ES705_42284 [subsurface metagenome]